MPYIVKNQELLRTTNPMQPKLVEFYHKMYLTRKNTVETGHFDIKNDIQFMSFPLSEVKQLLADLNDTDYLVFRYICNGKNLNYNMFECTLCIMEAKKNEIKKHSKLIYSSSTGKLDSELIDSKILFFAERRDLGTHHAVEGFDAEILGVAHEISEVLKVINGEGEANFFNVLPILNVRDGKLKTNVVFFLSELNVKPDFGSVQFTEQFISPAGEDFYDEGTSCCPIGGN